MQLTIKGDTPDLDVGLAIPFVQVFQDVACPPDNQRKFYNLAAMHPSTFPQFDLEVAQGPSGASETRKSPSEFRACLCSEEERPAGQHVTEIEFA